VLEAVRAIPPGTGCRVGRLGWGWSPRYRCRAGCRRRGDPAQTGTPSRFRHQGTGRI